jgi:hypothetical protein
MDIRVTMETLPILLTKIKMPGVFLGMLLIYSCSVSQPRVIPTSDIQRVKNSGIFALGYDNVPHTLDVLNIPYIIGGHVVVQWKEVEPSKGVYDFSLITAKVDRLKAMGKLSTLQINGNRKPDYLFDEVPWVEEKLSMQIDDPKGTLMYWHPAHIDAYKNLLKALGEYLSGREADFIGIRMNYNSLGTEHWNIQNPYRDASRWNYPEGVTPGTDYSDEIADAYLKEIQRAYIREIAPYAKVFVRNYIDTQKQPEFDQYFREGKLSLFHTSSEPEPRASWTEKQYQNFYEYCRTGFTTAYAESWTTSVGRGGQMESMPQWFYWRLLIDLHCGVSYIAVHSLDLYVTLSGSYTYDGTLYHDDASAGTDYKNEFSEALDFASRYAGYHASPVHSPGAWVAFRGNNRVRNNYVSEQNRKLIFFTGDYDFLMKRLPDNSVPVEFIGSRDIRFGSWARKLPKGGKMILEPDQAFIKSLSKSVLKVIWFDQSPGKGKISISAGRHDFIIEPKGEGKWQETSFPLKNHNFTQIVITAVDDDIILHMIEIERIKK